MIRLFCCLLLIISFAATGQEMSGGLSIGQWKSHLPYSAGVSVTQSNQEVFFATSQSLFSVDKTEESIQLYNKVSGLSDIGIRQINYNKDLEILFIAYENSNIDLLKADGVVNITDIKRKTIAGDKHINHIYFNEEDAWLSCGFGIVRMDLINEETKSTTFTPFAVYGIKIHDDYIYASTENGIYRIINNGIANILDFSIWKRMSTSSGLPPAYYSNAIEVLDNLLYADVNDTLFVFNGVDWNALYYKENYGFKNLVAGNGQLLASMVSQFPDKIVKIQPNGVFSIIGDSQLTGKEPQAIEDENGKIWIADFFRGYGYLTPSNEIIKFNVEGPYQLDAGDIEIADDEVWVAAANLETKWNPSANSFGMYSFIDDEWDAYRPFLNNVLDSVRDINVIKIHPGTKSIFAGTYGNGLLEYDRTDLKLYKYNSSLQTPPTSPSSYRVSGLVFDQENNLWVSNYSAPAPISVFTADRQWQAFTPTVSVSDLTKVVVDQNNYKWFATNASGVLVYDSGADLLNPNDDRYRLINSNNSELQTNDILSIAVDLDGSVWVGTSEGVVVFECIGQAFESTCIGRRPTFKEGNFDDYLLKTESVNTITIDGANRKWFGTNNGVFVLSENIEKQVYRFTAENSPLFNDNVVDIAINNETGEVFFSTESGIISYRNNAIAADDFINKNNVFAFPNPVRHDFDGEIAIKGLVADSNIKITDVSGGLVYETTSLGGQAVWNGRDYNGRKANTGIYLVYATSKDGTQKVVTKVMIVN